MRLILCGCTMIAKSYKENKEVGKIVKLQMNSTYLPLSHKLKGKIEKKYRDLNKGDF